MADQTKAGTARNISRTARTRPKWATPAIMLDEDFGEGGRAQLKIIPIDANGKDITCPDDVDQMEFLAAHLSSEDQNFRIDFSVSPTNCQGLVKKDGSTWKSYDWDKYLVRMIDMNTRDQGWGFHPKQMAKLDDGSVIEVGIVIRHRQPRGETSSPQLSLV